MAGGGLRGIHPMHAKAPDIPPYSKATQPTLGRSIRLAFQGARVAHPPHSVEEGDIYWANASLYTWANQSPIRVEGFTGQTPKPLNRPPSPHQNFIDFSKLSENSKNFTKYKEGSNYHKYRFIFSKLWR
jgi:hypothetical protein